MSTVYQIKLDNEYDVDGRWFDSIKLAARGKKRNKKLYISVATRKKDGELRSILTHPFEIRKGA